MVYYTSNLDTTANANLYVSSNYGSTFIAKQITSSNGFLSVSMNSSGQYMCASTATNSLYISTYLQQIVY